MKVWAVFEHVKYEAYSLLGLFDTLDKAHAFKAVFDKRDRPSDVSYVIEEKDVL